MTRSTSWSTLQKLGEKNALARTLYQSELSSRF